METSSLWLDGFYWCLEGAALPPEFLPDCNENGVLDACDIDSGFSDDCNLNGRPDECDLVGDFDQSGALGATDFQMLEGCITGPGGTLSPGCEMGDGDCDGDIDVADFRHFQAQYVAP